MFRRMTSWTSTEKSASVTVSCCGHQPVNFVVKINKTSVNPVLTFSFSQDEERAVNYCANLILLIMRGQKSVVLLILVEGREERINKNTTEAGDKTINWV